VSNSNEGDGDKGGGQTTATRGTTMATAMATAMMWTMDDDKAGGQQRGQG
jgi:hypothetical protein